MIFSHRPLRVPDSLSKARWLSCLPGLGGGLLLAAACSAAPASQEQLFTDTSRSEIPGGRPAQNEAASAPSTDSEPPADGAMGAPSQSLPTGAASSERAAEASLLADPAQPDAGALPEPDEEPEVEPEPEPEPEPPPPPPPPPPGDDDDDDDDDD